ncbi:hypothetical protein ABZ468_42940 [Streptomyces sp. NPDC005708]|uniref:LexA family protein n=1 Tax=Streptomyces sp. NPDC005708 TaxID=3154564 RepID=UPI0033C22918
MPRYKSDHLTERQEKILHAIREWVADTGEYPTLMEIGTAVGLKSKSAVHYQVGQMEWLGALAHERAGRRNVYRLTY